MNRNSSLLDDIVVDLLKKQLAHETYNANLYRTFASWCDANGLKNSTKIFNDQFVEEHSHANKIWDYLQDCGIFVQYPAIEEINITDIENDDEGTFKKLFELTLEREIITTESLKKINKAALSVDDYITSNFLRKLLLYQVTEEKEAHDRLDAFKHSKDNLVIDSYLE